MTSLAKTKEEEILALIKPIWQYAPELNKNIFHWDKLPKEITPLAGIDTSGLVKYRGIRYYINYVWKNNSITAIRA